jgi:intracellular multiplication protein IcmT
MLFLDCCIKAHIALFPVIKRGLIMALIPTEAHWRDSARIPRFFMIDARAAFPLLLFLVHIRLWSFLIALGATLFFGIIEHYGFSVPVFLRWARNLLAGSRKIAIPWWKE